MSLCCLLCGEAQGAYAAQHQVDSGIDISDVDDGISLGEVGAAIIIVRIVFTEHKIDNDVDISDVNLAIGIDVTAWQCVPWGGVRTAFASVRGALLFCASLLLPVLAGVHYAVPLLCALCALTGQNDTTNSNIQKGSVS